MKSSYFRINLIPILPHRLVEANSYARYKTEVNSSLLSSYYFNLYSIVCRISCTYFHLIRGFQFFSQKTSASMSLLLPVSSKNEGNLEHQYLIFIAVPVVLQGRFVNA